MSKGGRTRRAGVPRHGDLEIPEDLPFQRREWVAERIAWTVMALVVGAAVLGLFGSGWLSRSIAGDQGAPVWLEYERYCLSGWLSRIQHLVGGRGVLGGEAEQRLECGHRRASAIEPEDELVDVVGQMFRADAVVRSPQPRLQV